MVVKVKKSAKKQIKKVTKKKNSKNITKKNKKKSSIIKSSPKGKEFFLINGKKIKNYSELAKILEHLEEQIFYHHVTPEKNDFANWIKDVFEDITLAKQIAGIKNKDHLELVLYRKIMRNK